MHPNAILHEIQQLYNVRDRLDSLAQALITISGSVRNTATLLEVLVAMMKIAPLFGLDPATPEGFIATFLIWAWECGVRASHEERHLEVNYELASRSRRHSR
jgi:hypothetical protein